MFRLDRNANRIRDLQKVTFSALEFGERRHLQEWIAQNPTCLGEELLVIQKEFHGFAETNERLDLLALDQSGRLVIIENKLDDSGRDVTWQALKYASYCASLTRTQIRDIFERYLVQNGKNDAGAELSGFFDDTPFEELELNQGLTQRIILVAAHFRREVTSTVMWLLNQGLQINCLKVTPYVHGDDVLLSFDQIIPPVDAQEYTVSMAEKGQSEREQHLVTARASKGREAAWENLFEATHRHTELFRNVSPPSGSWVGAGSGIGGVRFQYVLSPKGTRVELYIGMRERQSNKLLFDYLHSKRQQIEADYGSSLEWQRLEDRIACRVKHEMTETLMGEDQDSGFADRVARQMARFEKAIAPQLQSNWQEVPL
ncbi:MAG: DUF4268 domain-containing protein [Trueperaceae bacterium]